MGTAQSERRTRREMREPEKRGGKGPGFHNPRDPTQTKNPDTDFGILPTNRASPPPLNDSTSSQLPFPPKFDSGGSPFHGKPMPSFLASPREPTVFFAIFEGTTIDDHHGSTPHEPRNMSQALVGEAERQRLRIEATLISMVLTGFQVKLELFPAKLDLTTSIKLLYSLRSSFL